MGNACISYEAQGAQGAPHQYTATTTTTTTTTSCNNRCQPRDGERDANNNRGGDGNNCAAITSEQQFASSQLAPLLTPCTTVTPPLMSLPDPDSPQDVKAKCSFDNAVNTNTSLPVLGSANLADTSSPPPGGSSHRAAANADGGISSGRQPHDDDADEALVRLEKVLDEDMSKERRINSAQSSSAQPPRDQSDDVLPHHTHQDSTSLSHPTRPQWRPSVHAKTYSGNVSMSSGRGPAALSISASNAALLIRLAGESVGGSVANNASLLATPRGGGASLAGGRASTMALFCPSRLDHRDSEFEAVSPLTTLTARERNGSKSNCGDSESLGAFLQVPELSQASLPKEHRQGEACRIPSRFHSSAGASSQHSPAPLVAFPRIDSDDGHQLNHLQRTTSPTAHLASSSHSSFAAQAARLPGEWNGGGMSLHSDGRAALASMSTWSQTGAGGPVLSSAEDVLALPKFSNV